MISYLVRLYRSSYLLLYSTKSSTPEVPGIIGSNNWHKQQPHKLEHNNIQIDGSSHDIEHCDISKQIIPVCMIRLASYDTA